MRALLLLLIILATSCTPTQQQIAVLPTLAILPSQPPTELPTATAAPSLTKIPTSTLTATEPLSATPTPNLLETQVVQANQTNEAVLGTLAALQTSLAPSVTATLTGTLGTTTTLVQPSAATPAGTTDPVELIPLTLFYARSTVNLRACASRTCDSVGQLTAGNSVMATGRMDGEEVNPGNRLWYRVDLQGRQVFAYSAFFMATPPTLPPAAPPTSLAPVETGIVCADGSISYAAQPEGACDFHGGTAGLQPPVDTTDSSGGFLCADGTISHAAHRQGACSHHGGIAPGH